MLVMPEKTTSPFTNIFQDILYVQPFSLEESRRLVREPAARVNHFFENEDIDFIIKIAGRTPFMIQKASLLLYNLHSRGLKGKDAYLNLANSFSSEMEEHFKYQMSHLTQEEYDTLVQVVRQDEIDEDSPALRILQNYGFVEKVNERYQILGETFADYLYRYSKTEH
jgi:hypothetical protein